MVKTPLLKSIYKKLLPIEFRNFLRSKTDVIGPKCCLILMRIVYQVSLQNSAKVINRPKTVLFYPQIPLSDACGIYKICHILRYKMSNNPLKPFDIIINWEDCTWRTRNEILSNLIKNHACLNAQCRDISKKHVQSLFEEIFCYPLAVNPLTYQGECVMKSNANFAKDGMIIKCPIQKTNDDYVYQKLINNQFDYYSAEEIRVPIFKGKIPFVCLKYVLLNDRFKDYFKSALADTNKILSQVEVKNIIHFCQKIGLEYGELDVLRDKNDGQIYIIDVNNTPSGPPRHLPLRDHWRALKTMARSFEEAFVSEEKPTSHLRKS